MASAQEAEGIYNAAGAAFTAALATCILVGIAPQQPPASASLPDCVRTPFCVRRQMAAFCVDGLSISAGALLGTPPVTVYVEVRAHMCAARSAACLAS